VPSRVLWKTRLCKLYERGRCPREECRFAHGESELREAPERFVDRRERYDAREERYDPREERYDAREVTRYDDRRDFRDRGFDRGRAEHDHNGRGEVNYQQGSRDDNWNRPSSRDDNRPSFRDDNRPPKRRHHSPNNLKEENPPARPRRRLSQSPDNINAQKQPRTPHSPEINRLTENNNRAINNRTSLVLSEKLKKSDKLRAQVRELEARVDLCRSREEDTSTRVENVRWELEEAQKEHERLEAKAKQMVGAVKHVLQRRKDLAALESELRQYVELMHREEFETNEDEEPIAEKPNSKLEVEDAEANTKASVDRNNLNFRAGSPIIRRAELQANRETQKKEPIREQHSWTSSGSR